MCVPSGFVTLRLRNATHPLSFTYRLLNDAQGIRLPGSLVPCNSAFACKTQTDCYYPLPLTSNSVVHWIAAPPATFRVACIPGYPVHKPHYFQISVLVISSPGQTEDKEARLAWMTFITKAGLCRLHPFPHVAMSYLRQAAMLCPSFLVESFGIEPNPVTCKASSATHR